MAGLNSNTRATCWYDWLRGSVAPPYKVEKPATLSCAVALVPWMAVTARLKRCVVTLVMACGRGAVLSRA